MTEREREIRRKKKTLMKRKNMFKDSVLIILFGKFNSYLIFSYPFFFEMYFWKCMKCIKWSASFSAMNLVLCRTDYVHSKTIRIFPIILEKSKTKKNCKLCYTNNKQHGLYYFLPLAFFLLWATLPNFLPLKASSEKLMTELAHSLHTLLSPHGQQGQESKGNTPEWRPQHRHHI